MLCLIAKGVLMSTDDLAKNALAILTKHIGETEFAVNQGPIVDWAIENWTNRIADETGWAKWCAGAVCTAYLEAGSESIKRFGSLNVDTLFARLHAKNLCFDLSVKNPKPGDLIFFRNLKNILNNDLNHVGLVEKVEDNKIFTVEGNSSNMVRRREYDKTNQRIAFFAEILI